MHKKFNAPPFCHRLQ